MTDATIAQIATLITLIIGFIGQWFREARGRKWQLKDANDLAVKVNLDAQALKEKLAQDNRDVALKVLADASALARGEAGGVNAKIERQSEELLEIRSQIKALNEKIGDEVDESNGKAGREANTLAKKMIVLGALIQDLAAHVKNPNKQVGKS